MAIQKTQGTFVPYPVREDEIQYEIVDHTYMSRGNRKSYVYDCKKKKEDPSVIVKWCRRNFGDRGAGWDFILASGNVTLIIWDDKLKFMYEMWQN
jgi:hypothetical protein